MEPPHERAAGYLQMTWTPTDQAIMERLLLEEQQQTAAMAAATTSTEASPVKPLSPSSPEGWRNPPSSSSDTNKSESSKGAKTKSTNSGDKKNDEERRARHRAVQRRFVQRKKEAFQRIKRLAQELEAKYRFLRITAEERNLRSERAALEVQCATSATQIAAAPADVCVISVSHPVDELIAKQMELVREFYEPLTADEYTAVQRSNQREYEVALTRDELYASSGFTIMGWHDHRKMDDATVKLALSKEFPNVRAVDLMNRTWRSLTSPATYASFFSPILTIKMQVLQVLDCNAIVIHRVLYHPQTQRASNSLEMLWRTRIGREFVIFDACLQNNAAQRCLGKSYNWTQMTTTMAFSPTPSDGCFLHHGGWLRRFTVSSVRYWLMEMFFMALRFESAMVSPVFALPPDDSTGRIEDGVEIAF